MLRLDVPPGHGSSGAISSAQVMETHKSFDGPSGVYTNFARADRLFAVPGVMEGIVNRAVFITGRG